MTIPQIAKDVENRLLETTDCYLLIAFTTAGETIVLKNTPTEKDERAINNVLFEIAENGGVGDLSVED